MRRSSLLEGRDVLWMLCLIAAGLALRLRWYSGFGLGDDVLFRHAIFSIVTQKHVQPDNGAYRFTWWFPTALACRIFGMSEIGMILPIIVIDALGIGLVYAFGKALWGRAGGVIAALLLIAHPLDLAWSTMITSDIFLSFFAALTMLCILRAFEREEPAARAWLWAFAGLSLWFAYHAKVSAVLMAVPIAFTCWRHRRRIDWNARWFLVTAGVFFGASALVAYTFTGDPVAPYHAELSYQGLTGPEAAKFHALTPPVFWVWLHILFRTDQLGDMLYSVYPHLLIALAVVGLFLGVRTSADLVVWFVVVFLGMQFNIQRVDGIWVAGFRNVRHTHVFVYPIILMLTGYLVAMRARLRLVTDVGLALLLAFSLAQGVAAATKTRVSFADRRITCEFLAGRPVKPVYSDFQIATWASITDMKHTFLPLESFDVAKRRAEIASIKSGYLVTGGGREPLYGCIDCIPRVAEIDPARWRLLLEVPGPPEPTVWRPEPLRIWEAVEDGDAAR